MKLTVVLISKNQDWNMPRLIESVLERTRSIAEREVILVDSASTDSTVEAASAYPIRVLSLHPDQRLTSHAGRYIGSTETTGEYILFLDGDMELYPGWVEAAIKVMDENHNIGVITGQRIDLPEETQPHELPPLVEMDAHDAEVTQVNYVGGVAIYRRAVLDDVGTFNPHLYSDGEPELCIRIRHHGYEIVQIQYPVAYHYSPFYTSSRNLIARWRRKLYWGAGQSLRHHFGTSVFWSYFKERGHGVLYIPIVLAGLLTLIPFFLGEKRLTYGWLLMLGLLFVGDVIRKRNLFHVFAHWCNRYFILDGTIRGFMVRPKDPHTFPRKFDIVQEQGNLNGQISSPTVTVGD